MSTPIWLRATSHTAHPPLTTWHLHILNPLDQLNPDLNHELRCAPQGEGDLPTEMMRVDRNSEVVAFSSLDHIVKFADLTRYAVVGEALPSAFH